MSALAGWRATICTVLTGRALWRLVGELGTHTGVAAPLVQVAASRTARPPSCGCPSPTKNSMGAGDSGCTGCSGSGAAGWQESVCTEAGFSSVTCTAASTAAAGSDWVLTGGAGGTWWSAGHAARRAAWVPGRVHQAIMLPVLQAWSQILSLACCEPLLPTGWKLRQGRPGWTAGLTSNSNTEAQILEQSDTASCNCQGSLSSGTMPGTSQPCSLPRLLYKVTPWSVWNPLRAKLSPCTF